MRIKPGFELRNICRENIIVSSGRENIDFTKLISMNASAADIWKAVFDKEFTVDDMVAALMNEYEVDEETARKDCEALAKSGIEAGFIDD